MPASVAISDIAATSVSLSVGLAGVSVRMSDVSGRIASETAAGFDVSTNDTSTPNLV